MSEEPLYFSSDDKRFYYFKHLMKNCTKCNKKKSFSEFYKDKQKKDGVKSRCKSCEKNSISLNKESKKKYDSIYYIKNKCRINKRKTALCKLNRSTDCIYKFKKNVRRLIQGAFKRSGNDFKKTTKTNYILGCSIDEFKSHIESLFKDDMKFENHGEWHLDHIIPLSTAKTEDDVIKLNHYTNFQPLWAKDNLSKGSKIK